MREPPRPSKPVRVSHVEMTEMVLPNDTNRLGNLLGGRLMQWIDIAAAISSWRHTNRICVTASVDELNFLHPIKAGEIVVLRASVNRAFRTSVEVGVRVSKENPQTGETRHTNTAYLTFVALDNDGKPVQVPACRPETEDERRRFKDAARRRRLRLLHRHRS
ncbi:MAG: acyl-CoA thioesterase [Ignavibacteria bacterium RIFCSPHIGHO2_02_FULL_56_12]|nr:MAG: acyl-CoA thioesterase [Ignavibacteria bacterium RIFCSPHIGHO2_02_FULL_56_12]